MILNIDTLYLRADNAQLQRLQYIAEYRNTYSYIQTFKNPKTNTTFDFSYTVQLFEIDNLTFKVKQFKIGSYRIELYGLHQYHKDNALKTNNVLDKLLYPLKHCYITRIDLCHDQKAKPQNKSLRTKKMIDFKGTIYHNLFSKNYFSSYVYDKQKKNNLQSKLYRTEYSFKGILLANRYKFQLRHLKKLIRRCENFIDKLPSRAAKINKIS